MFRFLFGTLFTSEPEAVKLPWKDAEDFFEEEVPRASVNIQKRYAEERPLGFDGAMRARSQEIFMASDFDERFHELELEYEQWHAERSPLRRFIVNCLWPYIPWLRVLYRWRHRTVVRCFQVVELEREVSVLKTILELERAEKGTGGRRGGKRKRPTLPPHMIALTSMPSLSLH